MEVVTQKPAGMSKGCLIGIIIASSLLFLLLVTGITCYVYRDDLAKWAATFSMNGLKGEVARHPEIVDTLTFDAFIDSFNVRVKERPLDKDGYAKFMGAMQSMPGWVSDHELDSTEMSKIFDAMVGYFPDLSPMRPFGMTSNRVDTTQVPANQIR